MKKNILTILTFLALVKLQSIEVEPVSRDNSSLNSSKSAEDQIADVKFFSDLNLTQLVLKNGMTVWLKPTNFEADEVYIKLTALGGFAFLDSSERASGEIAAQIAWESGLGDLSTDQLSVLLYEHSLELVIKILPFNRVIEGNSGKHGLKEFLKCVNMVFSQHKLTEAGKKEALTNAMNALSKTNSDVDQTYENVFLQTNTQHSSLLKPLSADDLKTVDLLKARKFFDESFSNPAEFVCIIVGSFELDEVKNLVNTHLGGIPVKNKSKVFDKKFSTLFPPGITQKSVHLPGRSDCLSRITFPLQTALNEKNIPSMEFMCQVIEARLRRVIISHMAYSHGVDVSYEFPLYPLLSNPWISIRFRSDCGDINQIKNLILEELKSLQEKGVQSNEILEIKRLESGSEEFWLRDNVYWVSMLSNYYLWNWGPEQIHRAESETQGLTPDIINNMLKSFFLISNYSVVSGNP